jgi:hypothetical protein
MQENLSKKRPPDLSGLLNGTRVYKNSPVKTTLYYFFRRSFSGGTGCAIFLNSSLKLVKLTL